jgi:hypothetical protein
MGTTKQSTGCGTGPEMIGVTEESDLTPDGRSTSTE